MVGPQVRVRRAAAGFLLVSGRRVMASAAASNEPLLSFVVAARDVEPYIRHCVGSLLATSSGIEVVAIDDGSTDGTAAALGELADRDRRVRLLRNDEPTGPGPARNRGLDAARGRYVWFVDGDDWALPGAVDRVVERLGGGGADVVLLDHVRVYPSGRVAPSSGRSLLERAPAAFRLAEWPQAVGLLHTPWNKVVLRELLDARGIRFSRSPVYEDVSFTYRCLVAAGRIETLTEPSYAYRTARPGALTRRRGDLHLAWSDEWSAAFDAASDAEHAVRQALFASMVRHGWDVLGLRNGRRIPRQLRRRFFEQFVALYWRGYSPSFGVRDRTLERGRLWLAEVRVVAAWVRWALGRVVMKLTPGGA